MGAQSAMIAEIEELLGKVDNYRKACRVYERKVKRLQEEIALLRATNKACKCNRREHECNTEGDGLVGTGDDRTAS